MHIEVRVCFVFEFMFVCYCVFFVCVQVEEGWWEGFLNGKTGMFPSNFTKEILTESDTPSIDTPTSQEELRSGRSSESRPIRWSEDTHILKKILFY